MALKDEMAIKPLALRHSMRSSEAEDSPCHARCWDRRRSAV